MLLRFPAALPVDNRLGMSLFGSALIHLLVILGIGFTLPKLRSHEACRRSRSRWCRRTPPRRRSIPISWRRRARTTAATVPNATSRAARCPRELGEQRLRLPTLAPAPQPEVTARRDTPDLFSQDAKTKIARPEPQPPRKVLQQTQPNPGLVARARRRRAQLNAEISREWQTFQGRPRHKYVNARTQEYRYALYMDAWRAKVERIGNLNYPEEAKRRHLTGSLVLDVALKADGTVASISVLRSSGQKLLDDAAMRIIELASPFAPFTPEMRGETDILHITRTWKFNETVVSAQ